MNFWKRNWEGITVGVIVVLVSTFILYVAYSAHPYLKLHVPLWLFTVTVAVAIFFVALFFIVKKKNTHQLKIISDLNQSKAIEINALKATHFSDRDKAIQQQTDMRNRDLNEKDAKIAQLQKAHDDAMESKHKEFTKLYGQLENDNLRMAQQIKEFNQAIAKREQAHTAELTRLRENRAREVEDYQKRLSEISAKEKAENDAKIAELGKIIENLKKNQITVETVETRPSLWNRPIDPFSP